MGLDTMLSASVLRSRGRPLIFGGAAPYRLALVIRPPWVGKIGASCLEQQPPEPPSVPLKQNQHFLSIDSSGVQIYMVVCWNEYIVVP